MTIQEKIERCFKKHKLPIVLHKSGKGKPGRGSCWVASTLYPEQSHSMQQVFAVGETLAGALDELFVKLCVRQSWRSWRNRHYHDPLWRRAHGIRKKGGK